MISWPNKEIVCCAKKHHRHIFPFHKCLQLSFSPKSTHHQPHRVVVETNLLPFMHQRCTCQWHHLLWSCTGSWLSAQLRREDAPRAWPSTQVLVGHKSQSFSRGPLEMSHRVSVWPTQFSNDINGLCIIHVDMFLQMTLEHSWAEGGMLNAYLRYEVFSDQFTNQFASTTQTV